MLFSLFSNPQSALLEIICRLPAISIALSFHEWAHAFAAYKLGDPTARNVGRMSINPFRHIDPIGFVMLLLVRFGWAKPVPINPRNFSRLKRDTILVSVAGIGVNFILAFITLFIVFLLSYFHISYNYIVGNIISNFYYINLSLMIFNILPIPPLDGYRVLESLLIRKFGPRPFQFLERYGFIILIVLLLTGILTKILGWLVELISTGLFLLFGLLFGI